jgi:hypothetical protein
MFAAGHTVPSYASFASPLLTVDEHPSIEILGPKAPRLVGRRAFYIITMRSGGVHITTDRPGG